jgi:hypothetical protein
MSLLWCSVGNSLLKLMVAPTRLKLARPSSPQAASGFVTAHLGRRGASTFQFACLLSLLGRSIATELAFLFYAWIQIRSLTAHGLLLTDRFTLGSPKTPLKTPYISTATVVSINICRGLTDKKCKITNESRRPNGLTDREGYIPPWPPDLLLMILRLLMLLPYEPLSLMRSSAQFRIES